MKYLLAPAPGDAGGAEGAATPRNVGLDLLRDEQEAKKKKEKHQRKGKAAFMHSSPSMKHLPAGLCASCAHECSPRRKSESSTRLIEMQSSELPVLVFTRAAVVLNLLKTPQVAAKPQRGSAGPSHPAGTLQELPSPKRQEAKRAIQTSPLAQLGQYLPL